MAGTTTTRQERLEARVTAQQKALFARAAALEGRTLTDFIVDALQKAARETIEEHEVMTLTAADQEQFLANLLNPPKPGANLKKAKKSQRRLVRR